MYAAFSPNGRWLATGGDARTIEIWDITTGKVSRTLKGHKQDVCAVAFSPDGRWLASASKDRTVKLWELSTGREVHTLTGHQDSVTSLAFSPNSRWLASSGWDKTVRIWDVATGRQVQILTGYPHPIYALAFDSRGGWLATGSADGTIKLWRLRKEIDLAVLGEPNGVMLFCAHPSGLQSRRVAVRSKVSILSSMSTVRLPIRTLLSALFALVSWQMASRPRP